jgi:hypothetical protein
MKLAELYLHLDYGWQIFLLGVFQFVIVWRLLDATYNECQLRLLARFLVMLFVTPMMIVIILDSQGFYELALLAVACAVATSLYSLVMYVAVHGRGARGGVSA